MEGLIQPALAFLAGFGGAGLPVWVSIRGQRHSGRVEWRQRFEQAVGFALSERPVDRRVGVLLLADLVTSRLGSKSDRALAERVSARIVDAAWSTGHTGSKETDQ